MSNYPAGAEFDPNAPYNQPDAKPEPFWVTVQVLIEVEGIEDAIDKTTDWLKTAKIGGAPLVDWQVDAVERQL